MHTSIISQRHSLSGFVIYHVSDPSILEQGKLGEDFFKYTLRFKRKYVNMQKHTKKWLRSFFSKNNTNTQLYKYNLGWKLF